VGLDSGRQMSVGVVLFGDPGGIVGAGHGGRLPLWPIPRTRFQSLFLRNTAGFRFS
jgi:hypothetical protein